MPYQITAARKNQTVIVSINQGGEEISIKLRGDMIAYSNTLTADMRTQAKLKYIICRFVDNIPTEDVDEAVTPDETPEVATVRNFTQDEILELSDDQLQVLFKRAQLDFDKFHTKEDLQDALLAMEVAWVDPAELGD